MEVAGCNSNLFDKFIECSQPYRREANLQDFYRNSEIRSSYLSLKRSTHSVNSVRFLLEEQLNLSLKSALVTFTIKMNKAS